MNKAPTNQQPSNSKQPLKQHSSKADLQDPIPAQSHHQDSEHNDQQQAAELSTNAQANGDTQADHQLAQLVEKISHLEEQLQQQKDKQLRILAETENVKRRVIKEAESTRKYALESFIKDLLPVLDSCHSAKTTLTDDQKQALEGIELIEKTMLAVLADHQVVIIDPKAGEAFDADNHQAMTAVVAQPKQGPNEIVEVFQKGVRLQGRLIRAALVVVTQ